jgi:hypothetical protein
LRGRIEQVLPVATFMEALARKLAAFEATLAALPEAEAAVRRNWLNGLLAEAIKMFALTDIVPAPAAELPEAQASAALVAPEPRPVALEAILATLHVPLKPKHAKRRNEALREVADKLDRHMETERSLDEAFEAVKQIEATGDQRKTLEEWATWFKKPPGLLTSLRGDLCAEGPTREACATLFPEGLTPAACANFLEKLASSRGRAMALATREHRASAAHMQKLRERNPAQWPQVRRKLAHGERFAKLVLRLCDEYFDISTAIKFDDERQKRIGPVVILGAALAAICGARAPSGHVFAKAKRTATEIAEPKPVRFCWHSDEAKSRFRG